MRRLLRSFTPLFLNPTSVKKLTDEYIETGKPVWNNENIKAALLELSNSKCAYCECQLSNESKYMEVEHFEDKKNNPNKVLEWNNLLPSCKRCNGSKGTHDVLQEPIINPFLDNPIEHLKIRLYRFKAKSDIGQNTIDVVDLNNYERIVKKRFDIGCAMQEAIEEALNKLGIYEQKGTTRAKNKLLGQIESILLECQPSSSYACTAASVLHSDENYEILRKKLQDVNLWSSELDLLHKESKKIKFECA